MAFRWPKAHDLHGCNAMQKFHPVLCKSAKQLHTYMNVLLHKVLGNLRGCIDFNQLWLFVGGQPQNLGSNKWLRFSPPYRVCWRQDEDEGWITVRRKVLPPLLLSLHILWIQPCAHCHCPGFWTVSFCPGREIIVWGASHNYHYWWPGDSVWWTPTKAEESEWPTCRYLPTNQPTFLINVTYQDQMSMIIYGTSYCARTYFPM